jgi:hypothetical protein
MTNCLVNHHITGHLVFVLVSTERVTICPTIDNPAAAKSTLSSALFTLKTRVLRKSIVTYSRFTAKVQSVKELLRQGRRIFKDE